MYQPATKPAKWAPREWTVEERTAVATLLQDVAEGTIETPAPIAAFTGRVLREENDPQAALKRVTGALRADGHGDFARDLIAQATAAREAA
jgi:hypothetical protein